MEPLILILLLVLAPWFLFIAKRRPSLSPPLPPGPPPLPIIGNLHQLGPMPNESLAALSATYGPLMTLRLGQVTTLVVSSAAMAREALQKHDLSLAGRAVVDAVRVAGHADTSVVWIPPGKRWRRLRALCNSALRLEPGERLRRRKVDDLLATVIRMSATQTAVDIGKMGFVTTLNLISNTIFSVDIVDIDSEAAQEFRDLVWRIHEEVGKPNVVDAFPFLRSLDPQGIRRKMRLYTMKLHAIFEEKIEKRRRSRAREGYRREGDFLDVLLDQIESGAELSLGEMKSLFVDLFLAGSDTSSDTVEWSMAELLRHPETMAKARAELDAVAGAGNPVAESDIPRLPYLQSVVKETLRLHPPVPLLIPHRAESDVEIAGHSVPKGTKVLINAWAIGRDGAAWEDPGSFRPERFLSSEVDYRGRDFELIPFGAGRRICPGLPLAHRMVHLMLASLVHSVEWRLPEGMRPEELDMEEKFGITLQRAVPLMAVPFVKP